MSESKLINNIENITRCVSILETKSDLLTEQNDKFEINVEELLKEIGDLKKQFDQLNREN